MKLLFGSVHQTRLAGRGGLVRRRGSGGSARRPARRGSIGGATPGAGNSGDRRLLGKVKPLEILRAELPAGTRLVGTHPLFGPNSGRYGVRVLRTVVCGGGRNAAAVARFVGSALGLDVSRASPEVHDPEMVYIQALSHLVARSLAGIGLPELVLKIAAFARLDELMALIVNDSAALFDTIVGGNPYAPEVLGRFVETARCLVEEVTCGGAG